MSKHWEKRGSESESEAEYSTKTSKKTHSNRKGNDYTKYDPQKDKQNVAFYKKRPETETLPSVHSILPK